MDCRFRLVLPFLHSLLVLAVSPLAADWHRVPAGQPEITSVVPDSSGQRIVVTTQDGGVWMTPDGGSSWRPLNSAITPGDSLWFDNCRMLDAHGDSLIICAQRPWWILPHPSIVVSTLDSLGNSVPPCPPELSKARFGVGFLDVLVSDSDVIVLAECVFRLNESDSTWSQLGDRQLRGLCAANGELFGVRYDGSGVYIVCHWNGTSWIQHGQVPHTHPSQSSRWHMIAVPPASPPECTSSIFRLPVSPETKNSYS